MGISRRSFMKETAALIAAPAAARWQAPGAPRDSSPQLKLDKSYTLQNRFGIEVAIEPKFGRYFVRFMGESWYGLGMVSLLVGKRWFRSSEGTDSSEAHDDELHPK